MLIAAALVVIAQNKGSSTGPQIIKKMRLAVRAASPLTGTQTSVSASGGKVIFTFKLMYPGYAKVVSSPGTSATMEEHLVGAKDYVYTASDNSYSTGVLAVLPDLGMTGFESAFTAQDQYSDIKPPTKISFHGISAYQVQVTTPSLMAQNLSKRVLFIDARSFMPLGFDDTESYGIDHYIYKNVVTHAHLTKKDFAWSPPKGAKQRTGQIG